jgi:hypothetical protein
VLDDLAPGDSMDGDSLHPHVSARGRDTEEVAGVLSVTNDPADDGVAVGVLVLDLVMEVREGVEPLDEGLTGSFNAGGNPGKGGGLWST